MRVAVIGSGRMGRGLAKAFSGSHEVTIGSRDPESAQAVAREAGATGAVGYADAARDADVVVLAVPWTVALETLDELGDLSGKVLIDIMNPYVAGRLQPLEGTSTAEEIQKRVPGARVVKGWNHVFAENLTRPDVHGVAATVLICGDDDEAKERVAGLARDAGFDPFDVGPLSSTRSLERLGGVTGGLGLGPQYALKILRY